MAAGSKTWGSPLTINQSQPVGINDEIPAGQWALVVNASRLEWDTFPLAKWNEFLNGDMSLAANAIQNGIPHSKVEWISTHWDNVAIDPYSQGGIAFVYGFKIEAIVKNTGQAALTGAEIVAILTALAAVGIIAFIIGGLVLGAWVTVQVMDAVKQLGPIVTVGVGLLILLGIGILLFVAIGGKGEYRGKKRGFSIGKG